MQEFIPQHCHLRGKPGSMTPSLREMLGKKHQKQHHAPKKLLSESASRTHPKLNPFPSLIKSSNLREGSRSYLVQLLLHAGDDHDDGDEGAEEEEEGEEESGDGGVPGRGAAAAEQA